MILSRDQALQKAKRFCAYSERCHNDVKTKLYSLGLFSKQVNEIIAQLIEEDYLNEERYAKAFAGGHFRQKKWGRRKIAQALREKQVSTYCIQKALKEIDDTEYIKTLKKLFSQKFSALKHEKNILIKESKLTNFLLQKGYEPDLIAEMMKENRKLEV